ncbi:MAG: SOS response-associated peptidase family protein [Christiangramia sp.]|uniref:SOS response-associated peptidase n=1 Tax=Christiangramia sp. TaxID=1931228 RepID=UPI0023569E8F
MCYKGTLTTQERKLKGYGSKGSKGVKPIKLSHHINAFTNPTIPIIAQEYPEFEISATWGLVPFWGKKNPSEFLAKNSYTLNARGEDFWETKSYKNYIQEGRCLILFDGFYEPHTIGKKKQPYYCYISEKEHDYNQREILPIAGIYSNIDDNYYVSLVTTAANDFFAKIHNAKERMPLVLDQNLLEPWLEPNQSKSVIDDIVRNGFTKENFQAHPVSNDIYKRDYIRDDAELIKPVAPLDIFI